MSDEEDLANDTWVQPDDPLLKVAECRTMVFLEPHWLSKVAYEKSGQQEHDADPEVYWDLAYLFDEFRALENHLSSGKFVDMFKRMAIQEDLTSHLHLRGTTERCFVFLKRNALTVFMLLTIIESETLTSLSNPLCTLTLTRQGALDVNCCSTRLLIMWPFQVADKTRKDHKAELAMNYLKSIAVKCTGLAYEHGGVDIDTGSNLAVTSGGCVVGLQEYAMNLHASVARSWRIQWDSMAPLLTTEWQSEQLPLLDVVTFLACAAKSRRKQQKKAWDKQRSGTEFEKLKGIVILFLRNVLHLFIWGTYMSQVDVYNQQVPSRRMSGRLIGLKHQLCFFGKSFKNSPEK